MPATTSTTPACFLSSEQLQCLASGRLTTCESKARLEKLEPGRVQNKLKSAGDIVQVSDISGMPVMTAKLVDAFLTTFGQPNARLIQGLGFGSDINRYKQEYQSFWQQAFGNEPLSDSTELLVTIYEKA
jgi:uncharacterized protein YhfF